MRLLASILIFLALAGAACAQVPVVGTHVGPNGAGTYVLPPSGCPYPIDNGCAGSTQYVAAPQMQNTNFAYSSADTGQLPGAMTTGSSITSSTLTVGTVAAGAIEAGEVLQGTGIPTGECSVLSGSGTTWVLTGTCPNVASEAINFQPSAAMIANRNAWMHELVSPGGSGGINIAGVDYPIGAGPVADMTPVSQEPANDGCQYYDGTNNTLPTAVNGLAYAGGPIWWCNNATANTTATFANIDFDDTGGGPDTTCVPIMYGAGGGVGSINQYIGDRMAYHLTQAFALASYSGGTLTITGGGMSGGTTMPWFVGQTISNCANANCTSGPGSYTGTITTGVATFVATITLSGSTYTLVPSSYSYGSLAVGDIIQGITDYTLTPVKISADNGDGTYTLSGYSSGAVSTPTTMYGVDGTHWQVSGSPPASGTFQSGTRTCWNSQGFIQFRGAAAQPLYWLQLYNNTVLGNVPEEIADNIGGTSPTAFVTDSREGATLPYSSPITAWYNWIQDLGHLPFRGGNAAPLDLEFNYVDGECLSDISNLNNCHGELAEMVGGQVTKTETDKGNTMNIPSAIVDSGDNSFFYISAGSNVDLAFSTVDLEGNLVIANGVSCSNTPDYADYRWGYGPMNPCTPGGGQLGAGNGLFNFNYDQHVGTFTMLHNRIDGTSVGACYRNSYTSPAGMAASIPSAGTTFNVTSPSPNYANGRTGGINQFGPGNWIIDPNTADNFAQTRITANGTYSDLSTLASFAGASVTSGSPTLTFASSTTVTSGSTITSGTGIPSGTTIPVGGTGTTFTMSANATATESGETILIQNNTRNCQPSLNPGCGTMTLAVSEPASSFPTSTVATTATAGATTITLTAAPPSGVVITGASAANASTLYDETVGGALNLPIPSNAQVYSSSGDTITLSKALTGTVSAGDVLQWLPTYQTWTGIDSMSDEDNYSIGGSYDSRLSKITLAGALQTLDPLPPDGTYWGDPVCP